VTNARGQSVFYVFGGRRLRADGGLGAQLQFVQAYNAATNTWTTKAPAYVNHESHGARAIDGKIYIGGGIWGYETYQTFRMYDPATDTWTLKQNVPVPGFGGVSVVLGGKLYLLATCLYWTGCYVPEYTPPSDMRFFGYYDPATNQWTALTPPPSGQDHQFGVAGALGGKLYFVGGRHTNTLDIYDPATKQWTSGAPMGSNRAGAASATVAGKLYVIAGYRWDDAGTQATRVATTSRYDPSTNMWTNMKVAPRGGPGLVSDRVVVSGQPRIQVVGGERPGNNMQYIP
jgi:N-acetylneuraminic acid mutarotase